MLEYFVYRYDIGLRQLVLFNIFETSVVRKLTELAVEEYLKAPELYRFKESFGDKVYSGFEAFCEKLRVILLSELADRLEYKVHIENKSFDCFEQCEPNIKIIAREVIWQYQNRV